MPARLCDGKRRPHGTKWMMNRLDQDTDLSARRFAGLITGRYDVVNIIGYGSRARGTQRPDSDVDVAFDVLLETGLRVSPCRGGWRSGNIQKLTPTRNCLKTLHVKAYGFDESTARCNISGQDQESLRICPGAFTTPGRGRC